MTCPHDFVQNELGESVGEFEPGMIDSRGVEAPERWLGAVRSGDLPVPDREPVPYLHVNRSTVLLRNLARADLTDALSYIRDSDLINHVHLATADCFKLPAGRLEEIVTSLRRIDHVQMIRLHSRAPIDDPALIVGNRKLLELIGRYSYPGKSIYLMLKIRHPQEISQAVTEAFRALHEAGANLIAEIPMEPGENDSTEVLTELTQLLAAAGVIPYQFILEKPAPGQEKQAIGLEQAYRLTEAVKTGATGLGRRIRLSLVRPDGLMEILAVENGKAYVKWHSSPDEVSGRFLIADVRRTSLWAEEWELEAESGDESTSPPRKLVADISIGSGYMPSNKSYLKKPHEIPD